ncbi:MAG: integrase catalytic domain-containing protein [Bacteroidales bacterium]|nr:integrase catalytic domain-containing protein [Bacteroidales bacterium]
MNIRHKCSFKLFTYGKNKDKHQIRLRVTFNSQRIDLSTGCQIYDRKYWDDKYESVLDGYEGHKGESAISINTELRNIKTQMETAFKYFEANDVIPTPSQLVEKYEERLNGTVPRKPEPDPKKKETKPKEPDLFNVFDEFVFECGEKNAWTKATFQKMAAFRRDLSTFKKKLKFSDLTDNLRDEKQLKTPRKPKGERKNYDIEDLVGIKNSTIEKKLDYLKWFLNWATEKGYNNNKAYKTFKPTLKKTQKKIIYLNKEEMKSILALELKGEDVYLEPIRDIFMFCCFSSLHYSDASSLKWNDVKEDHIEVTTMKTADSISIEINEMTRSLLNKYRAVPGKKNDLVFPFYTNQAMNRDLKKLCKMAKINEEIRITTYRGNERIDEIKPKWELIGTHTGRKTFIVNALSRGIPPSVVMKWTGHSDYKSMKPYIDIVDEIKASEMNKMNFMD